MKLSCHFLEEVLLNVPTVTPCFQSLFIKTSCFIFFMTHYHDFILLTYLFSYLPPVFYWNMKFMRILFVFPLLNLQHLEQCLPQTK